MPPKKKSTTKPAAPQAELIIEGARQNNLKNISLAYAFEIVFSTRTHHNY